MQQPVTIAKRLTRDQPTQEHYIYVRICTGGIRKLHQANGVWYNRRILT